MDHEILSRGKRVDNRGWIEGYYVRLYDGKGRESHRIYTGYAETDCGEFHPDWYEVDPDTVGRGTGLNDKRGANIFDGDILASRYDEQFPENVTIEIVTWAENGWCGKSVPCGDVFPLLEDGVLPDTMVIGNVYDDMNLLEELDP